MLCVFVFVHAHIHTHTHSHTCACTYSHKLSLHILTQIIDSNHKRKIIIKTDRPDFGACLDPPCSGPPRPSVGPPYGGGPDPGECVCGGGKRVREKTREAERARDEDRERGV
jgi:hypothetical protein